MCWPDDSQPPASQVCRWLPAIALGGAGADPSKAVQNPSGVCQGYETAKPGSLTAPAWSKPQTPTLLGFRLMPVSHSVKAWSKWQALGAVWIPTQCVDFNTQEPDKT